jgi:hypothetical protein
MGSGGARCRACFAERFIAAILGGPRVTEAASRDSRREILLRNSSIRYERIAGAAMATAREWHGTGRTFSRTCAAIDEDFIIALGDSR